MIVTGNRYFNNINWQTYWELVVMPKMVRKGISLILKPTVEKEGALRAYVNHGAWRVKCECGGCEYAWEEGLFMCQSCFNSRHKHQLRQVVFPAKRAAIESHLVKRPLVNRNWYPHETVEDLKRENREHKAELLEVN